MNQALDGVGWGRKFVETCRNIMKTIKPTAPQKGLEAVVFTTCTNSIQEIARSPLNQQRNVQDMGLTHPWP